MGFRIWIALCLALLILLWLVPHTNLVPAVRSYLTLPPLPSPPTPPSPPTNDVYEHGVYAWHVWHEGSQVRASFSSQSETYKVLIPCPQPAKDARAQYTDATSKTQSVENPLATLLIGQQRLESQKQEDDALDKRTRLYVQAGLTLLLTAACLYVLVYKKSTPTQRAAATGVLGIALGYWFK